MANWRFEESIPVNKEQAQQAPHVVLAASYRDPFNGAVFVHKDMVQHVAPWADAEAERNYLPPVKATEAFGDVESFAAYIIRYADPALAYITWNQAGIRAVLDYHSDVTNGRDPGRCQWVASYPFFSSRQLVKWSEFASGQAREQRAVIEFLEDMAETIVQPSAAELTGVLSMLRASVGSKADSTLNEDGSYAVSFNKEAKLVGKGTIPAFFMIRVQLLQGHTDTEGKVVTYDLKVRLRVTPTEQGAQFRLSIPNLAASYEDAWADRVKIAGQALGSEFMILRAADNGR